MVIVWEVESVYLRENIVVYTSILNGEVLQSYRAGIESDNFLAYTSMNIRRR